MASLNLDEKYTIRDHCRCCGSGRLAQILDLGNQPLANSLKKKPQAQEDRYPLNLIFCRDCLLVQLRETVKKEILFDDYIWLTQTSATARRYAGLFYKRAIAVTKARPKDFIIEIASNDGTFLKPFIHGGYRVLGVDSARNLAQLANKQGIRTMPEYWGSDIAEKIVSKYGAAKVVIARNVIPHVSELHDCLAGMCLALSKDGTGIIEFHYSGTILKDLHYDSIYHEHLSYFSLRSMEFLLNKHKLFSFHADSSPISGGSYVIYFSKAKKRLTSKYKKIIENENRSSVNKEISWRRFARRCLEHRDKSRDIVKHFHGMIIGFGASARSSTYLNFCGFSFRDIRAIIDNNRLKQGLFTAGSFIPIISMDGGLRLGPDLLFILAWNFKDEIIKVCREKRYTGDYLIPFPRSPVILSSKKRHPIKFIL